MFSKMFEKVYDAKHQVLLYEALNANELVN